MEGGLGVPPPRCGAVVRCQDQDECRLVARALMAERWSPCRGFACGASGTAGELVHARDVPVPSMESINGLSRQRVALVAPAGCVSEGAEARPLRSGW